MKENAEVNLPRYWVWSDANPSAEPAKLKEKYRSLKNHGIQGIFLSGGMQSREFEIIKEAGLALHTWVWTTNRADPWIMENHPDWYMLNRLGDSCFDKPPYVPHYRWVSPVIPGFVSYMKEQIDELASMPQVDGIHLDYVRFPDVILPRGLWAKYGLDQTEELPQYDYCYNEHTRSVFKREFGIDPLAIKNPSTDQNWLHFRYNAVTSLVKELKAQTQRHDKTVTAAVFPTPRIARKLVRQDWDKWPLDAVCPMIYNGFYNEPPEWVGEMVLENIQAVKFPVIAGLFMPNLAEPADFRTAITSAQKNGAYGLSLFAPVSDANWKVFEELTM